MEIIVELLIQLFVEVIGEAVFEYGFEGMGKALQSRVGRFMLGAAVGFGAGVAWGWHVGRGDQPHFPRSIIVSIVLAAVTAIGGIIQFARHEEESPRGFRSVLTWPWRWSADRLFGFTIINLAIAAGIYLGYEFTFA